MVVVWQTSRRAPRRMVVAVVALALLIALGSVFFTRMLMLVPGWHIPLAAGATLGALLLVFAPHRAIASVDEQGMLSYGWGDRMNLTVPLSRITGWRMISTGLLVGIGARVAPEDVAFLHRKGVSYRKMRQYADGLGTALVLEFLTQDDLERLLELQTRFGADKAPLL